MSADRMVKKVYKWKPMLTRPLGRPKNRWEDDISNDMKKLNIKQPQEEIPMFIFLKLVIKLYIATCTRQ